MGLFDRFLDWIRKKLGVHSPSAALREKWEPLIMESFEKGLKEGKENPRFWFDEAGNFCTREMTPDEIEGLELCREIVARAFPGYYDDFEEMEEQHCGNESSI